MGAWSFIQKQYGKANNMLNQFAILCLIIAVGYFIIRSVNTNSNNTDNVNNDYFPCEISSTNEDSLTEEALKTSYSIALINIDKDIYKTANSKNSIPALFKPNLTNLTNIKKCLGDDEIALVVSTDNATMVFPQKILNYHLIVNTFINDEPILITYSPLADHFEVFSRKYKNIILEFGVSGVLYKNTDLMYDTSSESLWSQFNGKAIVGNYSGAALEKLDYKILPIKKIIEIYDKYEVLSFNTGYSRNYNNDPFKDYRTDNSYIEPIGYIQSDYQNKDIVLGFNLDNKQYAVLESTITDNISRFSGIGLDLEFSKKNGEYFIKDLKNNKRILDFTTSYAFVWYDFFPLTRALKIQ